MFTKRDYIAVNTRIGKLEFGRTTDWKEMAAIMRLFRIPLITSYTTLTVQPSDSKLDDIITDSIKVIDSFSKDHNSIADCMARLGVLYNHFCRWLQLRSNPNYLIEEWYITPY